MTQRKSRPTDADGESQTGSPEENLEQSNPHLDTIRSILFSREQARIDALENETENLNRQSQTNLEAVQTQVNTLQTLLDTVRVEAGQEKERADRLQIEIDQLRQQLDTESKALIPRLVANLSRIISDAIEGSREAMADAMGPIMGDAIRVQIRDSREEMVEALFPIILGAVQRAIAEFAREMQRNIDARLKTNFRPQDSLRALFARARGISASELILRDALPFEIEEIFLIQHESGLLMGHKRADEDESLDSDLVSGMLTAIRDFARDSLGDGSDAEELDEIQYGDQTIIIESGQYVYIAAVVQGAAPEGFRTNLRQFVNELHIHYKPQLQAYTGDPATIPDLNEQLVVLEREILTPALDAPKPLSRNQKFALFGVGIVGLLVLACACFYLQFTIALLPAAFGKTPTPIVITTTPAPTSTHLPTSAPTVTSTATPSPQPSTPTLTVTATKTEAPTATFTATPSQTPESTPTAAPALTIASVWARQAPDALSNSIEAITAGTPVTILSQFGTWVEVEWSSLNGINRGWVPLQWIDLSEPIPPGLITPETEN